MTKLSNNKVEIGKGKKLKLGTDNDYELQHNPATGRLEITDTSNNKTAFVQPEDRGQIGDKGGIVKALANDEVLADDGYTYSTVQAAEQAADGWIFVPPATFNEAVTVETEGLTIRGAGYDSLIDGGTTDNAITVKAPDVTIQHLSVQTNAGQGNSNTGVLVKSGNPSGAIENCVVRDSDNRGIDVNSDDWVIRGSRIENSDSFAILPANRSIVTDCIIASAPDSDDAINDSLGDSDGRGYILANNIITSPGNDGIRIDMSDCIVIGNRIHNAGGDGIHVGTVNDTIVANNRISGSTGSAINNQGTNTTTDANLTGAAN